MTYSFEITITSYAEAVWKANPCGSPAANLVTAMMNYAESFRYYDANKSATTAAVRSGGAHYDCDCQKALAQYTDPYAEEMKELNAEEHYPESEYIDGYIMHVLINEPAIALVFEADKAGHIRDTAGQGIANAIEYTYTNYRGEKITVLQIFKDPTTGGWTEFYNNGSTVLAKCMDIDVIDVLAPITIKVLTCTELNSSNFAKSTFEELETVTYSVAEYYEYLQSNQAVEDGVSATDIANHTNSLEKLYVLAQAAIAYRRK